MARETPNIFAMSVAEMPFTLSSRALAASASSTLRDVRPCVHWLRQRAARLFGEVSTPDYKNLIAVLSNRMSCSNEGDISLKDARDIVCDLDTGRSGISRVNSF